MKQWRPLFTNNSNYKSTTARLTAIMGIARLGPSALAAKLGMPGSEELYRIAESKAPMPPELASLIHSHYPFIDLEWLLTGVAASKESNDDKP